MYFTTISQCVQLPRWKPLGALVIMQAPFLIHFERTVWTKDLSYGWKEPKTFVIFFSNEESSAETNLIKKVKQHKLLLKIWITSKIQQKKLPLKLKENSSSDGFKAAHGWIIIKKNNSMKNSLANIRISCDNFSLLWKLHVWTLFLCCVCNFKIHSTFNT